jgi:anti-sigma regulatory factor (Ser/Thr protein kinase)
VLATLPSAPFWARTQAKAALKAKLMPAEIIETTEHLVSELVTNAITISDPGLTGIERVAITLRLIPGQILIEVFDNNESLPVPAVTDLDSESGRGLILIDALSKDWGFSLHPSGGKTVYCTVAAPELADAPGSYGGLCR